MIGDLYVKFNSLINQNVLDLVSRLGGELLLPSLTEYAFHFYNADVRLNQENPRSFKLLRIIEGRYEKMAADFFDDPREYREPDFAEYIN